ncbi:MAG: hypothetical protein SNJ60_04640, partial [Pseudanabaenaceae cyanobacterium]
ASQQPKPATTAKPFAHHPMANTHAAMAHCSGDYSSGNTLPRSLALTTNTFHDESGRTNFWFLLCRN